jgi:hypothetical protein
MWRRMALWAWDLDLTWVGMSRLRPARHAPLTVRTTVIVASVWGLPLLLLGPLVFVGWRPMIGDQAAVQIGAMAVVAAWMTNLAGNLMSAMYWNERAADLRAEVAG